MSDLLEKVRNGDARALARAITLVENGADETLLERLELGRQVPITGITGPPGAGKSTLIGAIASHFVAQNKKLAIIAVDPSSPFNHGAIMGDRLRMSEHFLNPGIFIRSMATRGNLGGLAPGIFEVCDVLKEAGFDHILIETVGVGQSEVEIAGLADTTVLVLVPEAGDDIQAIKSGVMEIADVYVVNKADRDGAEVFYRNLVTLAHTNARNGEEAPVLMTIASKNEGIAELVNAVTHHHATEHGRQKKLRVLTEKAMMLIRTMRTNDVRTDVIEKELSALVTQPGFNLYAWVKKFAR